MQETTAFDVEAFLHGDNAGRYRSTAGEARDVDPLLVDELHARVERDGYVVLEGLFTRDEVEGLRAEVEPLFRFDGGRNDFEGHATRRVYGVLDKTDALNPLVEQPLVLALLDRLFLPNYLLSMLQVIDIRPGEAAQPLHPDDGFYPIPRPRKALSAATILAIDDFTADNGATVFVPGSHTLGDEILSHDTAATVPAVMPAGSVLFFLGTLWHGGGENRTDRSRMCATAQYCEPWLRPQEAMTLAVRPERVAQQSEAIQRMLGYSIHPPFIGQVDGMHPKRLLEPYSD